LLLSSFSVGAAYLFEPPVCLLGLESAGWVHPQIMSLTEQFTYWK